MKALFILLIAPVLAFAQGSIGTGNPVVTNPLGQPIPGATVAVCNSNPGSPTSGGCPGHLVTTYTDITAATSCTGTSQPLNNSGSPSVGSGCSNPGTVDGLGNVVVYAQPGQYWCEEYGAQIVGVNVTPCIFPATASGGAWSFTSVTVTGALNSKNIASVRYADQFTGSDIGAQINAAYADCPSGSCAIVVAAKISGTPYDFTTPVSFAVSGKCPLLIGASSTTNGSATPAGASLNFTPSSGSAITFDCAPTNATQGYVYGMRNITVTNNGCLSTGGCGGTAVGVDTGTTNQGSQGALFDNVGIDGFSVAYRNLNPISNNQQWLNPQFEANAVAILIKNTTGIFFNGGTMAGNGIVIKGNDANSSAAAQFVATQFFANAEVADFTAVSGTAATIDWTDCHFEYNGTTSPHFIQGLLNFTIKGGIMEDSGTGSAPDYHIATSGYNFVIDGLNIIIRPNTTNFLVANTPARGSIRAWVGDISHVSSFVGSSGAANVTQEIMNGTSANASVPWVYESKIKSLNGFDANSIGLLNAGPISGGTTGLFSSSVRSAQAIADQGTACTNGELVLSAGWGTSPTVTAVAGKGQTCEWTITAGTGSPTANPTVTDTLTNALPSALTICEMRMVGGSGTATLIDQTSLSATAPVFTFGGTPTASATYKILRRCGP